jgi:hypothetical protein
MQRVVRSSLVGLLTIAGLAACGDKVTVPPPTTAPLDQTVHSVTVSPASVTLAVGAKVTMAASVDAGAGVTVRTVAWSSSNTAVATVDPAGGVVTGVSAGTATIIAAATADPNVKGAGAVTVTAGGGGTPSLSIGQLTTTVCQGAALAPPCNTVTANLGNFGTGAGAGYTGQLDVVLNVDPNGATLKQISGTLTCGTATQVITQALSAASGSNGAEASAAPVTLSFPTTQFDQTTGVPKLLNTAPNGPNANPCTLTAQVQTTATSNNTVNASNSQTLTLNNNDGAIVTTTTSGSTATDANGFPWKAGDLSVKVLPVLYSGRTPNLVGASFAGSTVVSGTLAGPTQSVAAVTGGTTLKWTNTTSANTATNRVGQLTLTGGNDANGFPLATAPGTFITDSNGNDVALVQLNPPLAAQVRLDNQSPAAPIVFQIPARQQQWVSGGVTVSGTVIKTPYAFSGASATNSPAVQGDATANFRSGGDNGGVGKEVLTFFVGDNTVFTSGFLLGGGTQIGAANCPTTGLTQVADASTITPSQTNTKYSVRVIDTDALGNIRCADLGTNTALAAGTLATTGFFGVDVGLPSANFIQAASSVADLDVCPFTVGGVQQVPAAGAPCGSGGAAIKSFQLALLDDASGFSGTPVNTILTRLDPTAGPTATFSACVIGSGGSCTNTSARGVAAVLADNGSGTDGYYTYSAQVLDLARNPTNPSTLTRRTLVDRAAPVMGGIQVPSTIASPNSAPSANFNTSATDNIDLNQTDFTLAYPITPTGAAVALAIRSQQTAATALGTPFATTGAGLTPTKSFFYAVSPFVRTVSTTGAADAPQSNAQLPTTITGRVYDAAGNVSAPSTANIAAANIPFAPATLAQPQTAYAALQSNGATFSTFAVTNAATNISNCSATQCPTPANPVSVAIIAQATGTEQAGPPTFQFLNPFTQVQFYYQDPASTEWILFDTQTAAGVSDNTTATIRTFTWTSKLFDPPLSAGSGTTLKVLAIGVNNAGDGLATAVNVNIALTNP